MTHFLIKFNVFMMGLMQLYVIIGLIVTVIVISAILVYYFTNQDDFFKFFEYECRDVFEKDMSEEVTTKELVLLLLALFIVCFLVWPYVIVVCLT